MKQLTELNSWIELENHVHTLRLATIHELNQSDARSTSLTASTQHIQIDFSNQRLNSTTLELLLQLADECQLKSKIDALIQGDAVNNSEGRPALHTALRTPDSTPILINSKDIIPDIAAAREQIKTISDSVRNGEWLGFSGKPITDIVNIGMGGSDLGPRFSIRALSDLAAKHLRYHFVSDVDPNALKYVTHNLKPETTLFIVSSKSFTTKETLHNAKKALSWLNNPSHMDKHFIAVTANVRKAKENGFNNVLPIWEWVGGRYSLCSAISLITSIAIGYEQFSQLLAGAHSMDNHFQNTPFTKNLPVLLALLGIWNNNFLHIHNLLILVYAQQLEYFVPYIQQLDMESNGKSIDKRGRAVNHATGPIVWGGLGNQAQHSYYQLLCQGTHKVALDFVTVKSFDTELINAMAEAKRKILAYGVHEPENPNGYIPGNKPLNHIQLADCSPFTLGQLIALYEHKIYTQSVIWDINAFDQPGVESAKRQGLPSVVL
ncbi:glucose-6-phosphate isomerase [Legionella hackeliae]|uniref:Glucose-6-phosphate isomerase n=1 Tax=Legionella hackeliae TaxID=449 RepID=A0A0A8URX0_LEGHA|nr:glucose-6-phosphate isomerase [Legionella hackeliae]KTD08833.1 glucose-6-phosphate isomerase [Legionella hackeliae]CEK10261.1 Glucose-6-phosphate isomerase [Legionella hackeliae]STX46990.1 glucose-6-phosphate isomerase [Legionella hackeliae]